MRTLARVFELDGAWAGLVATPRGLRRVYLPRADRHALLVQMRADTPDLSLEVDAGLVQVARELAMYLQGRVVHFDVTIDLAEATEFQRAAWRACRRVAFGQTMTYAELAARAGRPRAARAIGNAMAQNPMPIVVPCHRVLRTGGGAGGYSGPGGVDMKTRLLQLERDALTGAAAVGMARATG